MKIIQKCCPVGIILALGLLVTACSHRGESEDFCRKGVAEFKLKEYKASLEDYNKAIAADSSYGMGWEGRGACEYYLNDDVNASKDEFKALALDSNLKNIWSWIGNVKRDLGDYAGSIIYYNKSMAKGGDDLGVDYEGRGASEYYLGDYTKATDDLNKAISTDTSLLYANYWRGMVEKATGDYKKCVDDFTIAINKGSYTGKAYEWRASAEYELKDLENALHDINLAMKLDTTLKNAHYYGAIIKRELNDYKGSIDDYTQSMKTDAKKDLGRDYEGRAIDEYYLKDYTSALADIDLAISDTSLHQAVAWKDAIVRAEK